MYGTKTMDIDFLKSLNFSLKLFKRVVGRLNSVISPAAFGV